MLAVDIPGFGNLRVAHLVLDYNGTLAEDGNLLDGVAPRLRALSAKLSIHVVTADTFGSAAQELAGLPLQLVVVADSDQTQAKLKFVQHLDASSVVAIVNGQNDRKMAGAVALAVAVVQREGAAVATLAETDVVARGIVEPLELLQNPMRLVATLGA